MNILSAGSIFFLTSCIFYNISINYKYDKFCKKDKSDGYIDCFPSKQVLQSLSQDNH